MLAQEAMLRLEAQAQKVEVEQQLRETSERFATLRRMIAETRHGLGNALTSILGNSELLSGSGHRIRERGAGAVGEHSRDVAEDA